MDIITKDTILELIENCQGQAISMYLPIFVSPPQSEQNPIRLKNLIAKAKKSLIKKGLSDSDSESYLAPVINLFEDESIWQDQGEGLAIFTDNKACQYFHLPESVEELVVVDDLFYISPLLPISQGNGTYILLSISQERPRLYRGSKYSLELIEDMDLPDSLQEMFDQFYEFHNDLQFHNSTNSPNRQLSNDRQAMYFGQGGGDEENIQAEIVNFFHKFDNALMNYLRESNMPLVLAGLEHIQPLYKKANSYAHLEEDGIYKDVSQMPISKLHEISWPIVKYHFAQDIDKATGVYHSLRENSSETTEELKSIINSAYYRRIHTLFVENNYRVFGKFDPQTGSIKITDETNKGSIDLINFAISHTLFNGGEVYLIDEEEMPATSKIAAVFHY